MKNPRQQGHGNKRRHQCQPASRIQAGRIRRPPRPHRDPHPGWEWALMRHRHPLSRGSPAEKKALAGENATIAEREAAAAPAAVAGGNSCLRHFSSSKEYPRASTPSPRPRPPRGHQPGGGLERGRWVRLHGTAAAPRTTRRGGGGRKSTRYGSWKAPKLFPRRCPWKRWTPSVACKEGMESRRATGRYGFSRACV